MVDSLPDGIQASSKKGTSKIKLFLVLASLQGDVLISSSLLSFTGGLADSAGGGEWIKRIDFSGRGRKTLMLEMHTQD